MANKSTSVRLSADDEQLRAALARHLGINKTGVIRMAMRKLARAEGVPVPEGESSQKPEAKKKRAGNR